MLQSFATETTTHLNTAFDSWMKRPHQHREKMSANYHEIRISSGFLSRWSSFSTLVVGEPTTLILTQHVTSLMFRDMIQQWFPIEKGTSTSNDLPPLSVVEDNSLRYAAGYVCQNIRKKLKRFSHPLKEELILGIMDLSLSTTSASGSVISYSTSSPALRQASDALAQYWALQK